jgi:hypothetical protein
MVQKQLKTVIETTAAAIERYLGSRPHAADTVEGIARLWLARQYYDDSVDMVQCALDLLVERGVVERLTLSGGKYMYRKAPDNARALI